MTDTSETATWYNQNAALEHERLASCPLEFSITWRIITQYLGQLGKDNKLEVLDLGGGTGRYALLLARLGHSVTLADISDKELEIASNTAEEMQVELTAVVRADAREVRSSPAIFREQKYDLVLCQGPLYHLLEENERREVLSACAEALRPNGIILAAFVLRYAHLRDIAQRDPMRLIKDYDSFYAKYLVEGRYTRKQLIYSYHSTPEDVKAIFMAVPELQLERLVSCEGFLGGGLSSRISELEQGAYERWVDVVLRFAEDQNILGNADHLLAVARRKI
ncbi:S-adenosyl-L-methionine-dependent methyltransferase [Aspergillus floccosus]